LIRDFRNPFTQDAEWELQVVAGTGNIITFEWDTGNEEGESYTVFNESDEKIADLTGSGNLDLELSTEAVFYIRN
jgi:hypothetical protein